MNLAKLLTVRKSARLGRAAIVLAVLLLTGCGAVRHRTVLEPDTESLLGYDAAVLEVTNETGVDFGFDVEKKLRDQLTDKLDDRGLLTRAGEQSVGLQVHILDYEKGNAFKRWLWPGYGSTVLRVECDLVDDGRKIGTVEAMRTVSWGGGYSIGAWSTIFGQLAGDIAEEIEQKLRAQ